jgi:hypothetical protein
MKATKEQFIGVTYEELLAENAKLRELVRDALRPKYDHTLLMTPVEWREYDDDVLRRVRELGVEVYGWPHTSH